MKQMNEISGLLKITAYCLEKLKQKQSVHGFCICFPYCFDFIKRTVLLFAER